MNSPELGPDERIAAELDREHLRPFYRWKGHELWPYCMQSEMVCAHVWDQEDTTRFRCLSFIFIHLRTPGEKTFEDDCYRRGILEAAWQPALFRLKILKWIGDIKPTDADFEEAKKIFIETMDADLKTRVAVVDTRTEEEKMRDESKKKESTPAAPLSAVAPSGNLLGSTPAF